MLGVAQRLGEDQAVGKLKIAGFNPVGAQQSRRYGGETGLIRIGNLWSKDAVGEFSVSRGGPDEWK